MSRVEVRLHEWGDDSDYHRKYCNMVQTKIDLEFLVVMAEQDMISANLPAQKQYFQKNRIIQRRNKEKNRFFYTAEVKECKGKVDSDISKYKAVKNKN